MAKSNKGRFRLSEMREKRAKALGGRYVEIEDDDGNVLVQIPRAAFWDAATYEDVVASGVAMRDLATLERVMDEDEFAKLKALGLELGDMRDLVHEVMRDVNRPESPGSSMP
ncbi:hypothetical protein [Spirillospora sp. CA-294931]|uniref:hypothetical protein n=1 Tax=Spirillospora sp. CA-294931 TaxID=3240042 RepID=UPI003D9068E1